MIIEMAMRRGNLRMVFVPLVRTEEVLWQSGHLGQIE
jgi:hypothetical protein